MPSERREIINTLLSDVDIAAMLRVSRSCIRVQRMKRRRQEDHWFEVDPVMLGDLPRYRENEVRSWICGLPIQSNTNGDYDE